MRDAVPQPAMNAPDEIRLEIDSDARNVAAASICLRTLCIDAGLPEQDVFQVVCTAVEGINNVIEHAYDNQPGHRICIRWTRDAGYIGIEIRDWGKTMLNEPQKTSPSPEAGHGRGWFIMREWMDETGYDTVKDYNRLRLIKHLDK
jgi:serine/threonine-protein kinase RsbW